MADEWRKDEVDRWKKRLKAEKDALESLKSQAQRNAHQDAFALGYEQYRQIGIQHGNTILVDNKMIDKEDKAKIYHFCQSLKKELRNYRVTIERIGAGEGIEGVYEFSNVKELPDNPLSELPEKEQNAYIGHWFEAFKEVFMKARDLGSW